jgi:hypothetical protein
MLVPNPVLCAQEKESGNILAYYWVEKVGRCSACGNENVPILDSMACFDCQRSFIWSEDMLALLCDIQGQLTYNGREWVFSEYRTMKIHDYHKPFKVQSRDGYFRAWAGNLVNGGRDLQELMKWVESKFN